jgi:hypothetical protein
MQLSMMPSPKLFVIAPSTGKMFGVVQDDYSDIVPAIHTVLAFR